MFKKKGFKWLYVPHGMLEPWSMQQKRLKKLVYYYLLEGRYSSFADAVRAVGGPEADNLKKKYPNTVLIPNGTDNVAFAPTSRPENPLVFLFMARLHFKKGILPLVKAWAESSMFANPGYKLLIAGPDDGELTALNAFLAEKPSANIEYLGPVYGPGKIKLLEAAHFYVLPSLSEGFPTSVVEAMLFGQVPLISKGCNFPEAFAKKLVLETPPEHAAIKAALEQAAALNPASRQQLSAANRSFIQENYTTERIADAQAAQYRNMLPSA